MSAATAVHSNNGDNHKRHPDLIPTSSPITASSPSPLTSDPNTHETSNPSTQQQQTLGKIPGRLLFGYTCKRCDSRQYRTMSKDAYEKGVVIIKCGGCQSLHLIADHLGWFDTTKKIGTIEDILKEQGREADITRLKAGTDDGEMEWLPDAMREAANETVGTVRDGVAVDKKT
ncbi:hypothetical protein SmJEL517_g00603 [Synchytrium microbalum]|uniref:DNL-type domain-containing protein n=1 Tax=Synchytrium microbalum TaxID=1806994 RepID=A0A507CJ53_9FUNG|nr:uncharacterized protein SmJEL517_g00603 [Synchytrium microbalum]TPX37743.1 hypothetical protein SmJEL517_g00603 [Synchytrium microbalum]